MMGIGGGTLCVPILTTFGFDIRKAVGTASSIGFLISAPAVVGYMLAGWGTADLPPASVGYVNLIGFILIVPVTAFCAPHGAKLAHKIPKDMLKLLFGLFLLITSLRMFWSFFA